MKRVITVLLFILSLGVQAQINVGSIQIVTRKPGQLEEADLASLKATKTLFLYRESDEPQLEDLKKTLSEAWKYTPLEFSSYADYAKKEYDESYSFLTIGQIHNVAIMHGSNGSPSSYSLDYFSLSLWMVKEGQRRNFCRIDLFLPLVSREAALAKEGADKAKYLYEEAEIRNWSLPYLKNSLQLLSTALENGEERYLYLDETRLGLKAMKNDTLYIPDYVLIWGNQFSGVESMREDTSGLMKFYPYPYKYVSTEELSALVLTSESPIYYLSYVKSSGNKYINVINSETGEFVYSKYEASSTSVTKKDFKRLAKEVKSASKRSR